MVKLASLYVISVKVAETIDDIEDCVHNETYNGTQSPCMTDPCFFLLTTTEIVTLKINFNEVEFLSNSYQSCL